MLELTRRFAFGIDLDDAWRYSGVSPPKSIIIPHLLSVSLPEGKILDEADEQGIRDHGEAEPKTIAGRAVLALAENLIQAKVDFVRCWFPWNYFEPIPIPESKLDQLLDQSYAQWPMDDLVNTLSGRGVGVVPVVACGYQRMLPRGLEPDRDRSLYLKRASIHARLLARHYKDRVRCWQIENEPNWWTEHEAGGWRSGLSWIHEHGFRHDLLQSVNDAIHSEDPNAITIINLEADAKILDPSPYTSICDIVGLDFYPNYKMAQPVDTTALMLAGRVAKGLGKPVMISETGYPSGPSAFGYSPKLQAEYVDGAFRNAYALEGVTAIGIWRYIDTSWRSFPPQENHFGLFDHTGTPKPAWRSLGDVIKELK